MFFTLVVLDICAENKKLVVIANIGPAVIFS